MSLFFVFIICYNPTKISEYRMIHDNVADTRTNVQFIKPDAYCKTQDYLRIIYVNTYKYKM